VKYDDLLLNTLSEIKFSNKKILYRTQNSLPAYTFWLLMVSNRPIARKSSRFWFFCPYMNQARWARPTPVKARAVLNCLWHAQSMGVEEDTGTRRNPIIKIRKFKQRKISFFSTVSVGGLQQGVLGSPRRSQPRGRLCRLEQTGVGVGGIKSSPNRIGSAVSCWSKFLDYRCNCGRCREIIHKI
jgi:hypothetical protein